MRNGLIACFILGLATLVVWSRRPTSAPARPALVPSRPDAAVLAAMAEEAERIAAPLRRHVSEQLAALKLPVGEEFGGDFPEVEALLAQAGLHALL